MEHLDTTFSPSSQEHQKSPVSGGETPSPPAEEKETAHKDPQNGGKKALCSLYITFWRIVEAEVWLRVECRQGDSSAVWGQLQGVMCQALERVMEEEEHGRRKKAFHWSAWRWKEQNEESKR